MVGEWFPTERDHRESRGRSWRAVRGEQESRRGEDLRGERADRDKQRDGRRREGGKQEFNQGNLQNWGGKWPGKIAEKVQWLGTGLAPFSGAKNLVRGPADSSRFKGRVTNRATTKKAPKKHPKTRI